MSKFQHPVQTIMLLLAVLALLAACSGDNSTPGSQVSSSATDQPAAETELPPLGNPLDATIEAQGVEPSNEAIIDTVDINLLESFPVQANAVVRGNLPDTCAVIDKINQSRDENTFVITVTTLHETGVMCIEQQQPFEEIVPLDVMGLPAGTYTVTAAGANSASNTFALSVDNAPPQAPAISEGEGAAIDGIVWEDSCQPQEEGSPAEGCIEDAEGDYRADGIFNNNEGRIAGVEVTLRNGSCPGGEEVIATATTDAAGAYFFSGLRPGAYCVAIDPASETNSAILLPGSWTYPDTESGSITLNLAENDYQTADFGWDYQRDAPPQVERDPACEDAAGYVADVTIPDDTQLAPAESFVKSWRVRNEGTCVWGPGYSLIFTGGDQMGGPDTVPLTQVVQPGEETDVSIDLTAPAGVGTHRSEWKFQNPEGDIFGSRGDFPLYLQIIVADE